jgi:hypothetical protein
VEEEEESLNEISTERQVHKSTVNIY